MKINSAATIHPHPILHCNQSQLGAQSETKKRKLGFQKQKRLLVLPFYVFSVINSLRAGMLPIAFSKEPTRSNCPMNTRLINLFICQSALPARLKAFRTRAISHSISEFPVSTTGQKHRREHFSLYCHSLSYPILECLCCDARFQGYRSEQCRYSWPLLSGNSHSSGRKRMKK